MHTCQVGTILINVTIADLQEVANISQNLEHSKTPETPYKQTL